MYVNTYLDKNAYKSQMHLQTLLKCDIICICTYSYVHSYIQIYPPWAVK